MCNCCSLEGLEYENIHSHSMYSNIYTPDSIISKEDIAKRAVELGQKTLSLVEHGYFSNIFETYDIAKKYGLSLIFGSEFYFVKDRFEKDRTNAHLLVMAKNEKGREEITEMVSESNKTGFYFKPRIDEELLFNLTPENVIVTTACIASPINKYEDYADYFIEKCKGHFGENFFLEVQPHTNIKQVEFNRKLQEYRVQHGVKFILGIDSHYIYADDAKNRDLFLQGKNIYYPEEEGFIIDFPTVEDILKRLSEQAVLSENEVIEAFESTLIARDFEPVKLDDDIKMPTIYPNLSHEEKVGKLHEIINNAWKEDRKHIPKDKWKEYLEAIKFETDIITGTNMEDYFLLNHKIIAKATSEYGGVLTRTGRGSAPSMYINKLFGFTEIDRLEAPITLYPTRFMSKSRILETRSLPDIDFNTANAEPFISATKDILGEDNAYLMTAYGKMKESEAFRNYCRAKGLEVAKFNEVGKDLESYRNDSYWGKIIEESEMFVGVIDSVSPHPCATLLLNEPLSKKLGVIKVGDVLVTLIDSYNSDKYKYLKNDYLTVTVWDIISKVYSEIGMPIDDVRQLLNKVESDEKVWSLYENGLVATLNQAGTASGKPQIMQYKPKNIRELSGWVSAIRPSFSSMKHYFLNRKEFSYGIEQFDKLLASSDNFILYQEDIMKTLVYAGFSEDVTYGLLKAIAKKKEGIIEPIHDKFINGFVEAIRKEQSENKVTEEEAYEQALKVWKIIEDAVGYGFNSSHAYAVALDSVYGAYLKANFPLEYYSTILNIYEGNTSKQGEIFEELAKFGITVKPIEFGKSSGKYIKDASDNSIYKGLGSIKFLNSSVADELYNLASSKDFSDVDAIELFKEIIDNTSANTRQMNILIRLGYFKQFGDWIELAEIFQCMTDSKKPDTDKYPEFKDKEVIIEKKNKKGEIRNELKIVKKPLKYSSTLKEETKLQRLQNIREYAEAVKLNPPTKPSVYNQIMFEKDNLGYSTTTYPNLPDNMVIVMDINTKYTPVVTFMKLNSGETLTAKVKKGKMYDEFGMPFMDLGYILKITDTHIEEGWKKVDDKWERDSTKNVLFVDKVKVIRREETTNDTSR